MHRQQSPSCPLPLLRTTSLKVNKQGAILYGVERKVGDEDVLMPRFDSLSYVNPLTNEQIAKISNYVLEQYGSPGVQVTPQDVAVARDGGPKPLLARMQPYIIPLIGLFALIILLLLGVIIQRRRYKNKG
ncbi:hypothetical protein [Glaciimonas sp. PCH181]|uniref:hypothetical protein n=1 Tax=Glaciimonas sp. PCH181 TaxID=2133943 RepID=UPI000D37B912|nr:hypothetical protein [Glaciimonas sp. PCH181]PUA19320.1 hypothetical protein C7W93_05450 [Glaciimonas sp. PCH181]